MHLAHDWHSAQVNLDEGKQGRGRVLLLTDSDRCAHEQRTLACRPVEWIRHRTVSS